MPRERKNGKGGSMPGRLLLLACCILAALGACAVADEAPLALHPDNPHYFLFRSKPQILITSGEHYGAVLNSDFDFIAYLDVLKEHGFNQTRMFSGTYREYPGAFNIAENTLSPPAKSFLCPWARSDKGDAGDGLNKFDLTTFDPRYFERLKIFISEAGKRGIVVELVLFCTMYEEKLWALSPMNAANNINNVGRVGPYEVYSAKEPQLTEAQEELVQKIVRELNGFDNLYYEICNEPNERGGLSREWNDRIVKAIVEAEKDLPKKHLIAQGIARDEKITDANPSVSILNFHAASPKDAARNYHLKRPIADDETGGKGTKDFPYRSEAWEFLMAGGGVFSHLDFSFTVADPRGTKPVRNVPGSGGPEIRRQLQVLKKFMESFDYLKMQPENALVRGLPGNVTAHVLAEAPKAFAVYFRGGTQLECTIDLAAGEYRAEWVNTRTGRIEKSEMISSRNGKGTLISPAYEEDVALRIHAIGGNR
jgi:hypothetical protein